MLIVTFQCIVIKDISPQAPVHLLVVPKKAIVGLSTADDADEQVNILNYYSYWFHFITMYPQVPRPSELTQSEFHLVTWSSVAGGKESCCSSGM
jgi:hypothetical protein